MTRPSRRDGHELRGRFRWLESVQSYIRYLRQESSSEDASESKFLDTRSRRMIAVARSAELQLQVLEGRLHRAEDIEFVMTTRDGAIRARLLPIPSRVGRLLIGLTDLATILELLNAEIHGALDSLAAYEFKSVRAARSLITRRFQMRRTRRFRRLRS